MSRKHYTALADCARHYIALKHGTKASADWVCPYCRIAELEAQIEAVKKCQRYIPVVQCDTDETEFEATLLPESEMGHEHGTVGDWMKVADVFAAITGQNQDD